MTLITILLLLITAAINPVHSNLSLFELNRRSDLGDRDAKRILVHESLLGDISSLQRVLIALLLVIFVLLSVAICGWLVGSIVVVIVAIMYGSIASLSFVKKISQKIYMRLEKKVINFIPKAPYLFKIIRSKSSDAGNDKHLGSSAELRHLIDASDNVLTPDEKKLIVHGLSFNGQLVSSIMTPRDAISSIDKSEFLGPLALNDLHKIGHSRLPVINGGIDHIVGVLNIQNMLTLDVKKSMTAEKAMDSGINYIRHDQTLNQALAAFLKTHKHLFIVINESRETVGLLTLNDVISELIGHPIIDEFDTHDNLHAVAKRKKV